MSHLTEQEKKALQLFKERVFSEFPDKVGELKLFGSKARGQSGKFSDIDILVILKSGNWQDHHPLRRIATNVMLETGVDLSLHIFTSERIQSMRNQGSPLLINIDREGVIL